MKKCLLFIFAILCKMACPQSAWDVSIEVNCLETAFASYPQSVYLVSQDNFVISSSFPFPDGKTFFHISESIELNNVYVAIRQKNGCIYRMKLSSLMNQVGSVIFGDVELKFIAIIAVDGDEQNNIPIVDKRNIRHFQYGYDKNYIETKYGPGHWYFPESKLVRSNFSHEDFISQYINPETYKVNFGHYPTKQEIDSMMARKNWLIAEKLAGLYSDELAQLNEPVLCDGYLHDVYRFDWSHNMCHIYNPYCIRIESNGLGQAVMHCSYRLFDSCEENSLYCDILPIDENTFAAIMKIIEQSDFWNSKSINENGGTNYILEGYKNGQYHVIFRGEGEDPALDELQKFLWSLTGLGENKIVHKRQRIE